MCRMKFNRQRRALLHRFRARFNGKLQQLQGLPAKVEETVSESLAERSASNLAITAAWVTGAVAVVAAGLYAGRELRSRYKLRRRTPYDYYAHSGDRSDLEFGVGI